MICNYLLRSLYHYRLMIVIRQTLTHKQMDTLLLAIG